jgi:hypothetical protein
MADLEDYFKHASSRRIHNLIALLDRRDPPPTMRELIEALNEEDSSEDDTSGSH